VRRFRVAKDEEIEISSKMPRKSWYSYKSSFDRKMKGNIIKTDIYIKPGYKGFKGISFDKRKSSKGEEATFAVYEKRKL
jgi:hypothetical protein